MKAKVMLLAMLSLVLMSCSERVGTSVPTPELQQGEQTNEEIPKAYSSLISKTEPYPVAYGQEATLRGQVVEVNYVTYDYAEGTGRRRENSAFVYLPYGYNNNTDRRYNIVYLVHGHYGDASTFLTTDGGLLRKVLDNMIEQGNIDPLIVVNQHITTVVPCPIT